jgi:hypothetical protein
VIERMGRKYRKRMKGTLTKTNKNENSAKKKNVNRDEEYIECEHSWKMLQRKSLYKLEKYLSYMLTKRRKEKNGKWKMRKIERRGRKERIIRDDLLSSTTFINIYIRASHLLFLKKEICNSVFTATQVSILWFLLCFPGHLISSLCSLLVTEVSNLCRKLCF